jgi:hypothetical protein
MSHRLMITTREASSQPRETGLQAEAATVERLRRQIAEMAGRGEPASPQLLAEFARVQKAYLDKKIGFEKQRRAGATEIPPADVPAAPKPQRAAAQPAREESTVGVAPVSVLQKPTATVPPSRTRLILIIVLLVGAIAAGAWYFFQAR